MSPLILKFSQDPEPLCEQVMKMAARTNWTNMLSEQNKFSLARLRAQASGAGTRCGSRSFIDWRSGSIA